MADEHRDQIRIVQETVAGKEITFAHIMGGPAPIIYQQGIIDWNELVRSLKKVGFDGYLSLELAGFDNQYKYAKESIDYIRKILIEEDALTVK